MAQNVLLNGELFLCQSPHSNAVVKDLLILSERNGHEVFVKGSIKLDSFEFLW